MAAGERYGAENGRETRLSLAARRPGGRSTAQVAEPLDVPASLEAAGRLEAGDDMVMAMSFLRLHEGAPSAARGPARPAAAPASTRS